VLYILKERSTFPINEAKTALPQLPASSCTFEERGDELFTKSGVQGNKQLLRPVLPDSNPTTTPYLVDWGDHSVGMSALCRRYVGAMSVQCWRNVSTMLCVFHFVYFTVTFSQDMTKKHKPSVEHDAVRMVPRTLASQAGYNLL